MLRDAKPAWITRDRKQRNIYDENVCLKDGKQYSESSVGNSRDRTKQQPMSDEKKENDKNLLKQKKKFLSSELMSHQRSVLCHTINTHSQYEMKWILGSILPWHTCFLLYHNFTSNEHQDLRTSIFCHFDNDSDTKIMWNYIRGFFFCVWLPGMSDSIHNLI